jgi:pimeloyl-ACP methyl ester carboxylesterase
VRRLVLASTTAYPDLDQYLDGWSEYGKRLAVAAPWPDWAGFERGSPRNDVDATIQWAVEAAPTAIWDLDRLDSYLALLAGVRFSGEWIRPFREGRLHPWRPNDPALVLRRFRGSTLILHGAQDMGFPVQVAQRLHDEVATSELAVIQSAGHMAQFDQPAKWAGAVAAFLDRC